MYVCSAPTSCQQVNLSGFTAKSMGAQGGNNTLYELQANGTFKPLLTGSDIRIAQDDQNMYIATGQALYDANAKVLVNQWWGNLSVYQGWPLSYTSVLNHY